MPRSPAASSFRPALPRPRGGWGIGAAFVGGAIVGAAVANSAPYGGYYVDGYRRCGWERQYDAYGYYVGTVRVCRVY